MSKDWGWLLKENIRYVQHSGKQKGLRTLLLLWIIPVNVLLGEKNDGEAFYTLEDWLNSCDQGASGPGGDADNMDW